LLNIAVNARDAMPQGGALAIEVRNLARGDASLAGDQVTIALRDTGTGVPPDVIGKVFDPFFTTKEPGAGTGLGLSQVYGFARQSGGAATIDSTPGLGTTITLRLPRSQKPLPTPVHSDSPVGGARVSGRILLVEDNPQVADVTAQTLTSMGFEVEVTDRARKALDRLEQGADAVDLLLTDVVLPDGLNGIDLAIQVRERFPTLPIVVTSGYNDVVAPEGAAFPMLRKPVAYEELQRVVRAGLEGAAA
jgi:two-component system NtrC family sensor kinase